jgi:glycosyltransferase involved in cell wall biosynthesis
VVGGGALESELKSLVETLGVADRVHLLGERIDATDLLSIADVCVRPGVVDGFVGVTVLEAQAQKVPVVSFDTLDVRPAVTDGVSGILVPPGDVDGLAEAIVRLLDKPDLAERIGLAGHSHFMKRYWIDSVVSNLLEIYASANGDQVD